MDDVAVRRVRDALKLIAGACESTTVGRCWNDNRVRGLSYSADSWCDACVAFEALMWFDETSSPEPGRFARVSVPELQGWLNGVGQLLNPRRTDDEKKIIASSMVRDFQNTVG